MFLPCCSIVHDIIFIDPSKHQEQILAHMQCLTYGVLGSCLLGVCHGIQLLDRRERIMAAMWAMGGYAMRGIIAKVFYGAPHTIIFVTTVWLGSFGIGWGVCEICKSHLALQAQMKEVMDELEASRRDDLLKLRMLQHVANLRPGTVASPPGVVEVHSSSASQKSESVFCTDSEASTFWSGDVDCPNLPLNSRTVPRR